MCAVRGSLLDPRGRLRPGHVRQADVHQDHVRKVLGGGGDALPAGRRLEGLEAAESEHVPRELQVLLVVVDDQDDRAHCALVRAA